MSKMIAYCGLNCENCDARKATVLSDDCLREKTAALWSKLNGIRITRDMINCLGCRGDGIKTFFCENMCKIRQCAISKGYSSCGECPEARKCATLKEILTNSEEARTNILK